jgi:integrase
MEAVVASLNRDHRGHVILRFRAGGRGSKHEYHNLGPITWEEAKDRAVEIQAEARRRAGLANPGITFAALAKTWMEIAGLKWKESTKDMNEVMLRLHVLPVLGAYRVEKLLPVTLENYRRGRLAEEKPPAPASLNLELHVVLGILSFGERAAIVHNPIPRGSVQKLPVEETIVYFEPEEWRAFIAAAESDQELRRAAPLWRLKLLTASRISEMVDLRWRDVDFERGGIAIRERKTGRTKTLTLTPAMRAVLAAVPRGIGDEPVFAHGEELPWDDDRLRRYFDRTVKAAGLVGDWTPHSLRHTAATWARKAAIPLGFVAKMLGHAGLSGVERYAHFSPEDLDAALNAVAATGEGRP